ncbi:hypothetical protein NZD89_00990 [Alicyclobacillus fastidiosus]|uniref:DUF1653 domain-containing protein n=1 Tax=Alicyclobacillus fastidiosus TaxID=392011 RepID=A0ABY6ZHX7_9BACL|nr:hypothetical protein [Alicyclobacillus fastidiosus]WAH42127.1 hypothetical protein NZD89_00990 [Alicyclobacillus fastidiosus]
MGIRTRTWTVTYVLYGHLEIRRLLREMYTKETMRPYVGKWVHCHSVYGMHEGIVYRAMREGLVLVHHTQLADGQPMAKEDIEMGIYQSDTPNEFQQVQFFPIPAPGLFLPYGGLYGVWPRPYII